MERCRVWATIADLGIHPLVRGGSSRPHFKNWSILQLYNYFQKKSRDFYDILLIIFPL